MTDNNREITNNELAEMIAETISASASELKSRIAALEAKVGEGLFTPDEKESLLNMVDHMNERLENDALGKSDIALTRPEYDVTADTAGFPNRFTQPSEAWAQ